MMIEVIVKAGGQEIGHIQIERVPGDTSVDYDSWHTYGVALHLHNIDSKHWHSYVDHRYGDEWPILVKKALDALLSTGKLDQICRREHK